MKKKNKGIFIFLIILIIISAIVINVIRDGGGSNTVISENEYFGVSDDDVAILYNYGLQKASGIYENSETYLPLNWVSAVLNDKFYWSEDEKLLIYTLPESVLYSDMNTKGSKGNPLLLYRDDRPYIAISVVKTYTDIIFEEFVSGDVKRVYINSGSREYETASAKRKLKLRVGGDKQESVIGELEEGTGLRLIEGGSESARNSWVKVYTPSGLIGYVQAKQLVSFGKKSEKSGFKAPEYSSISMNKPVVLGWHQITLAAGNKNVQGIIDNTSGMNVISPTWFSLTDNMGTYTSLASREYVDTAHKAGLQVWALIDNFNENVDTEKLLSKTEARKAIIERLTDDCISYGIDGINIDFESLKKSASKHYIQFIRELSVACRKNKLVLSVDVPAYMSFNSHYMRGELAEVVDYVINMGYDEHYAGSDMGSTASYEYVKSGIDKTLEEVDNKKLINAIPFYTRLWSRSGGKLSSKAMGINLANQWIGEHTVELKWNDELKQYYGEYAGTNEYNYIWMEEEKSLSAKMNIIKENELAGVACWKLGLEPSEIWGVVNEISK